MKRKRVLLGFSFVIWQMARRLPNVPFIIGCVIIFFTKIFGTRDFLCRLETKES